MLTLIYSFTQLLDTAEKVSNIAGYTARVAEMVEDLDRIHSKVPEEPTPRSSVDAPAHPRSPAPAHSQTLIGPGPIHPGGRHSFELSVHRASRQLVQHLADVFPDAPFAGSAPAAPPPLVVPTFQVARGGVDLGTDCRDPEGVARAAAEMDRMLDRFLGWASRLSAALSRRGYWANAVDPRTGLALFGQQGAAYSEAQGAAALLGYTACNTGVCDVVSHPVHGTRIYPATLATTAPLEALQAALEAVAAEERAGARVEDGEEEGPRGSDAAASAPRPLPMEVVLQPIGGEVLLSLHRLAVDTGAGVPAVAGLTLGLRSGEHLLVSGPSGCGKSTLLKALAGLWPVKGGEARMPPSQHVMFLPQEAVLAPTRTLAEQLLYPFSSLSQSGSLGSSPAHLQWLLEAVGLGHLWDRAGWDKPVGWLENLSPGELQRLSIARVLARRPALALLDEATSAIGAAMERSMYSLIKAAGITVVSVGHRRELEELHPVVLRLSGDDAGTWKLEQRAETACQT
uniref:Atp-binding cassette sub-family d member 1 n=1 Tax=Tetraselmis sp. GSL018 TaxID=582737 RepID=A0A061SNK9_9CHLO